MCYHPIKVNYHPSFKNYRGILIHPYNKGRVVNCGKCIECREQFIESWQVRWREQLKITQENSSYLLTLTYNDENLPMIITPDGEYKSTLDYTDVQKFIKRLRKNQQTYCTKNNIQNPSIKYHGCGEYGPNGTKRPHYHILITNLIIDPNKIEKIWGKGTIDIGTDITPNTINYVLKYTLKTYHSDQKPVKQIKKIFRNAMIYPFPYTDYSYQNTNCPEYILNYGLLPSINNSFHKELLCHQETEFKYNPKNSKNEYRVSEKAFLSKGIGKNFLTQENITFYQENPTATYDYFCQKKRKIVSRPLPRYYSEQIFNPTKTDEYGKNIYDSETKRPVKIHDKNNFEEYSKTPLFKKQLATYQSEQKRLNQLLQKYDYDYNILTKTEYALRLGRKRIAVKRQHKIEQFQKHTNILQQLENIC